MLGSEGMFGVITEVTLRIRPVPEVRRYGSIVFPDFREGVNFMREMAKQVGREEVGWRGGEVEECNSKELVGWLEEGVRIYEGTSCVGKKWMLILSCL